MASMQIVGGAGAAAAGKAGNGGGIDPVLMGLSPDAAAAAGMSGEGSLQEHPFASELAAALATLDAQQAQALAESLLDGALQDGQVLDAAALAQATGQNLPVDPAFQSAILASFAALTGAVQADLSVQAADDGQQGAISQAQAIEAGLMLSAAEAAAADAAMMNVSDSAVTASADEAVAAALTATNLKTNSANTVAPSTAATAKNLEVDSTTALSGSATSTSLATAAASDEPIASGAAGQSLLQGKSLTNASAEQANAGTLAAATHREANASAAAGQGAASQGQSQSGSSSQDQAAIAASITEAARSRVEKDASEYASKQTSLAGTAVNDVGNVVVNAKPNAEGVAAAADAARQSAQRTDAVSAAAGSQASAQTAEAARAESRLEAARASLGSGPLNVEVLKLTRQGGGRAVLEVTPPNQGPIRIDLQLDGSGRASLVVEGLTDSMKARLESSAHFLRQDMAQMGLALNLEMRERNDSGGAAQAFAQSQFGQSSQGGGRDSGSRTNAPAASSVAGNNSVAQRSAAVDDGIHLVA